MKKKLIVAIDGPAGAGKSTVAKLVAKRLKFIYIDTGAMYRALTYKALKNKINLSDEKAVVRMARNTDLQLKYHPAKGLKIILDNQDVSREIRREYISRHTNTLASIQGVRKILRQKQRAIGKNGKVVMEGRDITTAVFPDARYKFYLDASIDERARRRYKELLARGQKVKLEKIKESIRIRDWKDKHRGINPLRQAPDAIPIDSTNMTLKEVANFIIATVKKCL